MGLVSLLFSFNGRINRAQYWLGALIVFVGLVLSIVLLGILFKPQQEFTKDTAGLLAMGGYLLAVLLPPLAVSGWANHALMVKRLHDRGRPGWVAGVHAGLALLILFVIFSSMGSPQALAGALLLTTPLSLILWIFQIVLLIDLGFLPSKGPNKYGDGPGSSGRPATVPSSGAPSPAGASTASSLFGAQTAMDRAIAEQARRAAMPAQPKPAMATAGAPNAAPSFGKRTR